MDSSIEMSRANVAEAAKTRAAPYEQQCQEAARFLADHPLHRSDPFTYGRALNLLRRGVLSPKEVRETGGQISV